MLRLLQFNLVILAVMIGATIVFCPCVLAQEVATSASAETSSEPPDLGFLNSGDLPTSIEQLRAMEKHVERLTKKAYKATVNIQVGQAQGSGVVVSRDGYILTAAHVIGGPNLPARITFPNGDVVSAKTLGVHRGIDTGMLKISKKGRYPYLDIGESDPLEDGHWVVAIGHPGGIDPKRGLVVRVGRMIRKSRTAMVTDCTLVGGDSGGPLLDMDGYVIGIHSRIGSSLTDNIHVPIDVFSEEWDELAEGKRVGEKPRAYVGFRLESGTNEIRSINDDGPAKNAGLKKGDVITKIEKRAVENAEQIRWALSAVKAGSTITIEVERDEETLSFEIETGERY